MQLPVILILCWAVWLAIVWLLGSVLKLTGADRWVLSLALAVIGLLAALLIWWWRKKKASQSPLAAGDDRAGLLLREAAQRLAASALPGSRRMQDLPAVLFVGAAGSAKTSSLVNSGVNEALLAGNVWNGQVVAPTSLANLWLAGQWVVAELGGAALEDATAVRSLIAGLRTGKANKLFGKAEQAPRAVIVAAELGAFYHMDAAGVQAAARKLRSVLVEAAAAWGSRVPVYVLFTKLDAVPFFHDFVRQLDQNEASRFFGVRLPFADRVTGVWDQQETDRLQQSFDSLFLNLDVWRREMLIRETDLVAAQSVYEFPREFRKLREPVVRFLLDLSRPNPLEATPLLRGFYFSGVRPVTVETRQDAPAPTPSAPTVAAQDDFGATIGFSQPKQKSAPPPPPVRGTKRVPQWTFLPEFISGQVFGDRIAMATSGQYVGAGITRKILLGALCGIAGVYFLGATVSFFRNYSFEGRVADSAATLSRIRSAALTPAGVTALEQLRTAAKDVTIWQQDGAPFFQRWGVYPGQKLHDNTRAAYCKSLDRFVLAGVRENLRSRLSALPASPSPTDDYDRPYRALKAYLMMTSEGKRAQGDFLTGELQTALPGDAAANAVQFREHLNFYSYQRAGGFCPAEGDAGVVESARQYLAQFPLVERTYRSLLTDLNAKFPPARYADPKKTVLFLDASTKRLLDAGQVDGAFTKPAFAQAVTLIRKAAEGTGQEDWVLGGRGGSQGAVNLGVELKDRYIKGYAAAWNDFLHSATVARFANLKDASDKLKTLAVAERTLFRPFCLATEHTSVDAQELKTVFKPVHELSAPPETCQTKPDGEKSKPYGDGLLQLSLGVDQAAEAPASEANLPQAAAAKGAALTLSRDLSLDTAVSDYLLQPIVYAEALVKSKLPSDLNGAGANACAQMAPLFRKVPFADSGAPASFQEVNTVFQPGQGLLTQMASGPLQSYITLLGDRYMPNKDAKIQVSDGFLAFFNRVNSISRTFYKTNPSGNPDFTYVIRVEPSPEMKNFELRIDGASLKGTSSGGQTKDFKFPGDGTGVHVIVDGKELAAMPSMWGVFEFFRAADRQPGPTTFEWDLAENTRFGRTSVSGTRSALLRLSVDMRGGYPVFGRPGLQVTCVSRVAK